MNLSPNKNLHILNVNKSLLSGALSIFPTLPNPAFTVMIWLLKVIKQVTLFCRILYHVNFVKCIPGKSFTYFSVPCISINGQGLDQIQVQSLARPLLRWSCEYVAGGTYHLVPLWAPVDDSVTALLHSGRFV